jgi:hypothetical protein
MLTQKTDPDQRPMYTWQRVDADLEWDFSRLARRYALWRRIRELFSPLVGRRVGRAAQTPD